jgi:small subunit ribosomal protein S6
MAREYELVLMLDPEASDSERDKVADSTGKMIESGGTLKHADTWGMRKMAYEINRRTEADYRFWRFEASNELLQQLNHALKITDGALRFRIFRVDPRSPVISPVAGSQPTAAGAESRGKPE